MKQKEVTDLLDGLFEYTNIKQSSIKSSTKKRLVECMQELTYMGKKFSAIQNREISRSYTLEFSEKDVRIIYKGAKENIIKYCRKKGYSPIFREGDIFQAGRDDTPQWIAYEKYYNSSVTFLCLGHEIGHCISYEKTKEIMRSPAFHQYTNRHRLRSKNMMEELLSWYESLPMCRHFIDKGYPILKGFTSLDELCDYIDLCLLSQNYENAKDRNKFIPKKVFLINREKVREIIGTKIKFSA